MTERYVAICLNLATLCWWTQENTDKSKQYRDEALTNNCENKNLSSFLF